MKEVLARGRVLGNSSSEFIHMLKNDGDVRTFILKSGKQAKSVKAAVLNGETKLRAFIGASVNGHDQAVLSHESATGISHTTKPQQFFSTAGREINKRAETLDGTRRRAVCIHNNVKFGILVTKDDADLADTRRLAKDTQTAREHDLRELGKRLEVIYGTSMTKEEIALAENTSSAGVTRAFRAASVPDEMVSVFPIISDISLPDYQFLLRPSEEANHKETSVRELMDKVRQELMALPDYPVTDKSKILLASRAESKALTEPPVKAIETEKLKESADHSQFARKKADSKR